MTTIIGVEAGVEYTAEDLLRFPDGKNFELIDRRLVEKPTGGESSFVCAQVLARLSQFSKQGRIGWVFNGQVGYHCFPQRPRHVRKPDASYIRRGRFPDEHIPRGDIQFPPDLAVEVVSPTELYIDVDAKVCDFLQVGVRLIWVVDPATRTALVFHPDGSARRLREEDDIDGGDVLPGFRCRVGDFFPPPIPEPQTPSV